jgi:hypothetical protein
LANGSVPEPATFLLTGFTLVFLGSRWRSKRSITRRLT